MNIRIPYLPHVLLFALISHSLCAQTNEEKLRIYNEASENGFVFFADNLNEVAYTVRLEFPKLENVKSDMTLPLVTVIPARSKRFRLMELTPAKNAKTSFSSTSQMYIGDFLNAKVDTGHLYIFPFAHGTTHKIDQGYGGRFSHQSANYYSLDFDLYEGDTVYAARSGTVVELKEDSNRGGADPSNSKFGNFLTVLHDDGSLAQYVHLKKNGVFPQLGDQVSVATPIALSGKTGWADGAHLHFMVMTPTKDGPVSLPVAFGGKDGPLRDVRVDGNYLSLHPGKPLPIGLLEEGPKKEERVETESRDILKDVEIRSGKVLVTSVKSEEVVYVVASNGTNNDLNLEISITGSNFISSHDLPVQQLVKKNKKMILTTLKEKNLGQGMDYKITTRTR